MVDDCATVVAGFQPAGDNHPTVVADADVDDFDCTGLVAGCIQVDENNRHVHLVWENVPGQVVAGTAVVLDAVDLGEVRDAAGSAAAMEGTRDVESELEADG